MRVIAVRDTDEGLGCTVASWRELEACDLAIMLRSNGRYRVIKDRDRQGFTQPELAVLFRLADTGASQSGHDLAKFAMVHSNAIGARLNSLRMRGYLGSFYSWRHRCLMWELA